jgi:F-type H+-transporting ATPase subunit delta
VHAALRGYTIAVIETAVEDGTAQALADELLQVDSVLENSRDLFTALTDVGVPAPARRAVVEEIFAQRVSRATLRLVVGAVLEQRADELTVGLHSMAELARRAAGHFAGAIGDPDEDEPGIGRLGGRSQLAGFAAATFEDVASVLEIEQIESELFRFARVVEGNLELRRGLANRGLPSVVRQALVTELLVNRTHPQTLRLALEASRGRGRDMVGSLDWLAELAARARGWRIGRVWASTQIETREREHLSDALQHLTGQPVELQITLDPSLIGGAVIQIGDLLVDSTIKHRLEQMQEHLLGPEGAARGVKELI